MIAPETDTNARGFIHDAGERPLKVRAHGTRAKYVIDKCRCKPCREANRLAVEELTFRRRVRMHPWTIAKADGGGRTIYVVVRREDAQVAYSGFDRAQAAEILAARELEDRENDPVWFSDGELTALLHHLRALMDAGVGIRQISKISGVSKVRIGEILDPSRAAQRGKRTQRWVRRGTGNKLMGVTTDRAAAGAHVDATQTRALIACMRRIGLSDSSIASAYRREYTPAIQLSHERVFAKTARAIADIHDGLFWEWPRARELCDCEQLGVRTVQQPTDDARAAVREFIIPNLRCSACGFEPAHSRGMGSHRRCCREAPPR